MRRTATAVLARRVAAEAIGSAFLLAALTGAGTMAAQLAPGNAVVALVALSLGTGGVLLALALAYGALSGAHFNPAISVAAALMHTLSWRDAIWYVAAQVVGAFAGTAAAFVLFGDPLVLISGGMPSGVALTRSELLATFGLVAVFCGCARARPAAWPFALAGCVAAIVWFSAAPTLGNPAIAVARAGLYPPGQVPWAWLGVCLAVQAFATAACVGVSGWLFEDEALRFGCVASAPSDMPTLAPRPDGVAPADRR